MSDQILRAGPPHAALLATLHAAIFPHAAWTETAFLSLLAQPGSLALIHEAGGILVLRVVLDEAEILTFGTTQRRQGIGSALLRRGLSDLRAANTHVLHLEVAERNEAARCFYEKFGFVHSGRRKAYYEDGDDALMMRLSC